MSQHDYKEIIYEQLPEGIYKENSIETKAIGTNLNRVQSNIDKLECEVNPLTIESVGLETWERFFKLPSNPSEEINNRRAKVLVELLQFVSDENVIRKDEMELIMSLFADKAEVIEHFADYVFDVILKFTSENQTSINTEEVSRVISKVKPSWLGYTVALEFKPKDSNIYVASYMNTGESITVYPWMPKEVEFKGKINISLGNSSGLEDITIYPRKEAN